MASPKHINLDMHKELMAEYNEVREMLISMMNHPKKNKL